MRLQSTGSKFISYLMPILTRTRSSRSRPESWRWERNSRLMYQQASGVSICWFSDGYNPSLSSLLPFSVTLIPLFSILHSSNFSLIWGFTNLYLVLPLLYQGKHSLCCNWLKPADWGERKEDPGSSLPLGSGWSGEPRAQWLPQTTHHARVSLPGKK